MVKSFSMEEVAPRLYEIILMRYQDLQLHNLLLFGLQQILELHIIQSYFFVLFAQVLKLFLIGNSAFVQFFIQHGICFICGSLLCMSEFYSLDFFERFKFCF